MYNESTPEVLRFHEHIFNTRYFALKTTASYTTAWYSLEVITFSERVSTEGFFRIFCNCYRKIKYIKNSFRCTRA